jgi:hypothetical protein
MRRAVAIALGLVCTTYSAWLSWEHFHSLLGPIAAVTAAGLFIFGEHAGRDRHWHHCLSLGVLGVLAAVISGSVVLMRNADTQAERARAVMSDNLPKAEARKALAEAKEALDKAEAAAGAECSSGRGRRCDALETREKEARQRVTEARAKLVSLGATTAENPMGSILGGWADTFNRALAVAPAIWLELAAPALLAYGFAPVPRKEEPKPKKKARRRKTKRAPRKPAGPSVKAASAAPRLRLVAANDD